MEVMQNPRGLITPRIESRLWLSRQVASFATLIGSITMGSGNSAQAQGDPLAYFRWQSRVLVVLAHDLQSPQLAEQRRHFEGMKLGAAERDLVLIQPTADSPEAIALKTALGLGNEPFQAVLVGKDGGAKLRFTRPITGQELVATIDAMPMRQNEMRQGTRSR